MAKQYVVTEEEFMSLIESLELHKLRGDNICDPGRELTAEERKRLEPAITSMHRGFHMVAVRWVQKMVYGGYRGAS